MALKNSDLRAFAPSAQTGLSRSSESSPIISVALVAMIGLGGAYAWQTGFFSRVQPVARLKSVLPNVSIPATFKSAPATETAVAPTVQAVPAMTTPVDPHDAADALARVLSMTMVNEANVLRSIGYMPSFEGALKSGAPDSRRKLMAPPRRVDPKDVVAVCTGELEQRLAPKAAALRTGNAASNSHMSLFTIISELALCTLKRAQPMLCEKQPREQVIAHVKFYDQLRGDILKAAGSDERTARLVAAALANGVHGEIVQTLQQIGAKGGLKAKDISLFPSNFLTDTLEAAKAPAAVCPKV
ncbi:MAG: hypothetical protein LCH61_05920 [Proteobacteria bacterium]|nr:hypothetical protein [Pseudomonadota bacterium]